MGLCASVGGSALLTSSKQCKRTHAKRRHGSWLWNHFEVERLHRTGSELVGQGIGSTNPRLRNARSGTDVERHDAGSGVAVQEGLEGTERHWHALAVRVASGIPAVRRRTDGDRSGKPDVAAVGDLIQLPLRAGEGRIKNDLVKALGCTGDLEPRRRVERRSRRAVSIALIAPLRQISESTKWHKARTAELEVDDVSLRRRGSAEPVNHRTVAISSDVIMDSDNCPGLDINVSPTSGSREAVDVSGIAGE